MEEPWEPGPGKRPEGVTELTTRKKKQRKVRKISDCLATRGDRIHPELRDTEREMGSHRDLAVQAFIGKTISEVPLRSSSQWALIPHEDTHPDREIQTQMSSGELGHPRKETKSQRRTELGETVQIPGLRVQTEGSGIAWGTSLGGSTG